MQLRLAFAAVFLFTIGHARLHAQDMTNLGLLTGSTKGTYYEFGNNINTIVSHNCSADIVNKSSEGSLANLRRLRREPFVQMAIVQHDVLSYVNVFLKDDRELKDWADKYRYVFSLYPEEIHIVTRKNSGIRSLEDLAGKTVAVGAAQSGTYLTATLLLNMAGVSVTPVEIPPDLAVEKLLENAGEPRIDAFFSVVGKPSKLLAEANPRYRSLTLVSITAEKVFSLYQRAEIGPDDYDWLDAPVRTASVMSALISFDFKKDHCDNVAMIARQITDNLEELQRIGHAKWGEVRLDAPIPGWKRYQCVSNRMRAPLSRSGARKCAFAGQDEAPPPPTDCPCNRFSGHEKIICEISRGRCPSS